MDVPDHFYTTLLCCYIFILYFTLKWKYRSILLWFTITIGSYCLGLELFSERFTTFFSTIFYYSTLDEADFAHFFHSLVYLSILGAFVYLFELRFGYRASERRFALLKNRSFLLFLLITTAWMYWGVGQPNVDIVYLTLIYFLVQITDQLVEGKINAFKRKENNELDKDADKLLPELGILINKGSGNLPENLFLRANIYYEKGDYSNSLKDFNGVISLIGESTNNTAEKALLEKSYSKIGLIKESSRRWHDAKHYFNLAKNMASNTDEYSAKIKQADESQKIYPLNLDNLKALLLVGFLSFAFQRNLEGIVLDSKEWPTILNGKWSYTREESGIKLAGTAEYLSAGVFKRALDIKKLGIFWLIGGKRIGYAIESGTFIQSQGYAIWEENTTLSQYIKRNNFSVQDNLKIFNLSPDWLNKNLSDPIKHPSGKISVYGNVGNKGLLGVFRANVDAKPNVFDIGPDGDSTTIPAGVEFLFNGIAIKAEEEIRIKLNNGDKITYNDNTGKVAEIITADGKLHVEGAAVPYSVAGLQKLIERHEGKTEIAGAGVAVYNQATNAANIANAYQNLNDGENTIHFQNIDFTLQAGKSITVTSLNADGTAGKSTLLTASRDTKISTPEGTLAHEGYDGNPDQIFVPTGSQLQFDSKAFALEEFSNLSESIMILPTSFEGGTSVIPYKILAFTRNCIIVKYENGNKVKLTKNTISF